MTEQNAPENEPSTALANAAQPPVDEDAGRLTNASRGRLIAILVMLALLTEIVPLQVSMVSNILPGLAKAFPDSGNSTTWAVTILGVVGGATIALVSKAGDLYGKKRIMVWTGVLVLCGMLMCALAPNWPVFLIGRGIASVSFGMNAVNYGIVRDIMPRRWIPVCVGILGAGLGMSAIIAPLVSGALTDHFSWQSIFWFQVIYLAVVIPLFLLIVPESPIRSRQRFDIGGAVLLGAGVALTLIYLSQGTSWGWTNAGCLAYLVGGLVLLVGFVVWEGRVSDPMMELSLLRSPKLSMLFLTTFFITGVQTLMSVLVSYMFQTPTASQLKALTAEGIAAKVHQPASLVAQGIHFNGDISYGAGYTVMQLAVHITMWTAVFTMLFGPVGGLLARRYGARVPLISGTTALLAACALWVPWHSTWQQQISIGVLLGLGSGFFFAAWPNLIIDTVPADRQGISSGMFNVFGAIGSSLPTALMASIMAAHPVQLVMAGPGGTQIVSNIPHVYTNDAYTQLYLLLGVIPCAIGVLLAVSLRNGRAPARGGAPVADGAPVVDGAPATPKAAPA